MAKSTYISQNLTQPQIDILLLLDDHELEIFTLQELKELAPKNHDVNEIMENLVHKRLLSRLERGKYCRPNFRDEKVIGTFLVEGGAVAYWSALNLHGLTEQFPNTMFIQTTKVKPQKDLFGVTYRFIKVALGKRAGIIKEGQGNYSYAMTDMEKTLVDCFDLPQYSGGYAELIRAFATAMTSADKMIGYCKAVNNMAVTKRLGYLSELLQKKGMGSFILYAKTQIREAYNLLDPLSPEAGNFDSEWKLRLNISEIEIMEIVNRQY